MIHGVCGLFVDGLNCLPTLMCWIELSLEFRVKVCVVLSRSWIPRTREIALSRTMESTIRVVFRFVQYGSFLLYTPLTKQSSNVA